MSKEIEFNEDQLTAIDLAVSFINESWEEFKSYYDSYPSENKSGTVIKPGWFAIRGPGGTGKTTITKEIAKETNLNRRGAIASTYTHTAKKQLQKKSEGLFEVCTLAKLIGTTVRSDGQGGLKFVRIKDKAMLDRIPLRKAKFIIIDEGSMLSKKTIDLIEKERKPDSKIIVLLDGKQLAPVDDPTDSPCTEYLGITLKKVERYSGENGKFCNNVRGFIDKIEELGPVKAEKYDFEILGDIDISEKSPISKVISRESFITKGAELVKQAESPDELRFIAYRRDAVSKINQRIRKEVFGPELAQQRFVENDWIVLEDMFEELNYQQTLFNGEYFVVHNVSSSTSRFETPINLLTLKIPEDEIGTKTELPFFQIPVVSQEGQKKFTDIKDKLLKIALTKNIKDYTKLVKAFNLYMKYVYGYNGLVMNERFFNFSSEFRSRFPRYYDYINSFANVKHGYCTTAYKCQGQTIKNVFVDSNDIFSVSMIDMKRKLQAFYTGISRAQDKLFIYE